MDPLAADASPVQTGRKALARSNVLPTLGVLGGMGPLATVDFLRKLVDATPAQRDQDHIPLIVRFCPEVPDRAAALAEEGPSPEPALVEAARALEAAGAAALAIPCNTAHAWYDVIGGAVSIPILHIADAAVAHLPADVDKTVGLLATAGTLRAAVYQKRAPDIDWLVPTENELSQWVMPGIQAVKAGDVQRGRELLRSAAGALVDRGAKGVLMGCTEVPIALSGLDSSIGAPLIDSNAALARACVQWALEQPAVARADGG